MAMFGFDISSAQAGIDVGALPGDLVIIKATGGTTYVNPYCDQHYRAAKAAGKKLAVYHFVHDPGQGEGSAVDEAHHFLTNIQGYLGEAIVLCDWEGDNVTDSAYALEFKRVVESEGGVRCVMYGSVSQLEYLRPCYEADSPIWAAGYSLGYQRIDGYNPPAGPIGVPDGMVVSMWQFTSTGYLPGWGRELDLNIFYGDAAAWDRLAARTGTIITEGTITPVQEDDMTPEQITTLFNVLDKINTNTDTPALPKAQYWADLINAVARVDASASAPEIAAQIDAAGLAVAVRDELVKLLGGK